MAKRLAVLVAMLAMVLAVAAPAFAQQQAAQGGEISVTGVVERLPSDGGPSPYGITDEASGVLYVLDRGEGGFSAYEGQRVTIEGTVRDVGADYKNLDVIDIRAAQDGAGPDQYGSTGGDPVGAGTGEQTAITGLFSVGQGGWSFVTDEQTGQDYYLVGTVGLDPQAIAGKRVVARGAAECGYDGPVYGCTLAPSSITPIGKGHEATDAPASEESAPAAVVPGAKRTNGNAGATVVSGDTNDARGGNGSASASDGAVRGIASSAAKVLPSTGGALPVVGLAGALLLTGGLLALRRISR